MPQMSPLTWLPIFLTMPLIILTIMASSYSIYSPKIQIPNLTSHKNPTQWKW